MPAEEQADRQAGKQAGRPRPPWHTVRPFVIGIACFAVLAAVDQARDFTLWRNYALSGIVLGSITTYILWRADVRIPRYIQWVIVAGLFLHYVGGSMGSPDPFRMGLLDLHGVNGAYHEFSWWDNLTHAVGIGAGAMAIAYLVEVAQLRRGLAWQGWAVGIVALLGALAAGVVVELYEYLGKAAFQTIDQGGYVNTMRDLHFNILGATIGAVLAVVVDRRRIGAAITRRWGRPGTDLAGRPWTERMTPGLTGFVAFAAVPTMATLVLSARFLAQGAVADDAAAYEAALQTLLWSFATGLLLAPLATFGMRRLSAREGKA
jgi:hypothetical protein